MESEIHTGKEMRALLEQALKGKYLVCFLTKGKVKKLEISWQSP